ncbi:iojap-like ribosome-associated protein [Opitutaceae bacterium TAV1]|nr:Iojap family protein [Opitutaceae bacterium TAV5]EIP98483.1 iojap-like ribosome-associated protein [Opitutaceae bacterium TAV1]
MSNTRTRPDTTRELLRNVVIALADKKAEQLAVLHVTQSDITDYLVLATGNSDPHLRALRIEAERILDTAKAPIAGMEQGGYGSGWTVVDAYQIMIHLFTAEQRANYALERLWKDAEVVDIGKLVTPPKAPKATKKPAAKTGVAKSAKAPAKKVSVKKGAVKAAKTSGATKKPAAGKAKVAAGKKKQAAPL